ncbi:restriction endonuclease subunit S [Adlercreutzia muris]|uniref:restriction endonuclease subunit S n=1 Tax=Adlercreutzia muris TaxID=1796610 RepID=UPI00136582BA|nr:restriction endonuclease subunit S [Adlercreutzia muris]NCA32076.1 restriction endonuclease subunit S [Adlercreutzia muris]
MADQRKCENDSVPALRFEGFSDPWEQRRLGEFIHASGLRNADNLDFESYSVSNTSGFVPQSEQFENGGTMAEADKTAYWIVEPGSFAYNPARINVGSIGYLSTRENVIVSSLYEVFRSDETCDDRFLWHWFKTALFAKQIEALQEGGVRLYFFFDKLLKSRIAMPSTGEQHAIGSFFDLLDSLITLHQRKVDKLKTVKQSLLEKMFPREGENVPEIRFEGFTDPWEQRKLGELYKPVCEKNDLSFETDKIISVAAMRFNPEAVVSDREYLRTYNVMRVGDIAFEGHSNKEFSHGRFVENVIGDGIVSHIFIVFRPNTSYDLWYWKYAINNERLMRSALVRSTKASTMMHDLVANDFLSESIPVPSLPEQHKIGALFAKLDSLITLHQRELEILKNLKQACLEKMFV